MEFSSISSINKCHSNWTSKIRRKFLFWLDYGFSFYSTDFKWVCTHSHILLIKTVHQRCKNLPFPQVEMMKSAEIIFTPYNYILDPLIVSQRELSMTDNVSEGGQPFCFFLFGSKTVLIWIYVLYISRLGSCVSFPSCFFVFRK